MNKKSAMSRLMPEWKIRLARKMARNMSWSEKRLWSKLRNNNLGVAFKKQFPMLGYIADFWCPSVNLVVEVDGKQHLKPGQKAWDILRDAAMRRVGISVLRVTAREIARNLPAVVMVVRKTVRGLQERQKCLPEDACLRV